MGGMPEEENIVDAEIVPDVPLGSETETETDPELQAAAAASTELARRSTDSTALFGTNDPQEITRRIWDAAEDFKKFVVEKGLTQTFGATEHIEVEAWQLLGARLGVTPGKPRTKQVAGGWHAEVELYDRNGRVVGGADAVCLDSEPNWKSKGENDRLSMAQTRAVGKAFRGTFGFIAKASGYEQPVADGSPGELFGPSATEEQLDQFKRALLWQCGGEVEAARAEFLKTRTNCGGYIPGAVSTSIVLNLKGDRARRKQAETLRQKSSEGQERVAEEVRVAEETRAAEEEAAIANAQAEFAATELPPAGFPGE